MKRHFKEAIGFTLLELLLVMTVIAALAALVYPALANAKTNSQRATCLNNLRQISLGVLASPAAGLACCPRGEPWDSAIWAATYENVNENNTLSLTDNFSICTRLCSSRTETLM